MTGPREAASFLVHGGIKAREKLLGSLEYQNFSRAFDFCLFQQFCIYAHYE